MINKTYIIVLAVCSILLGSCGVQQKTTGKKETKAASQTVWHTCTIQGVKAVVTTAEERMSATVNMYAVRDSLIIVSIMPMLGIEMARLEATPTELIAYDKVYNRYAQTTYEELNRRLVPQISWQQLQQICSAELPTGKEKAQLVYSIGKESIRFDLDYVPRQTDIPLKMVRLPMNRYKKMDISEWL